LASVSQRLLNESNSPFARSRARISSREVKIGERVRDDLSCPRALAAHCRAQRVRQP
jgi:hypothetical protein